MKLKLLIIILSIYVITWIIGKVLDYITRIKVTKNIARLRKQQDEHDEVYLYDSDGYLCNMAQAEEDYKKPPKKIHCSICDKEIHPDEFKRKEIYSSYMPDGLGLPDYHFHKRCRNPKVILYENPKKTSS